MKKAIVVIGANYGDEGKGRTVDYLSSKADGKVLNVLTNGGAQRGHTVYRDENNYHIFHHFGSGTFRGAATYISRQFIVDPMTFEVELMKLFKLGIDPTVYVHRDCRFSTPWDMILNQIVESIREKNAHGSCGMGIWETCCRYDNVDSQSCPIRGIDEKTIDGMHPTDLRHYLINLRDGYFKHRLRTEYNLEDIPQEWRDIWYSDGLIHHYMLSLKLFMAKTIRANIESVMFKYNTVIFEYGQGLLLDANVDPTHSTPSSTGYSKYVIDTINRAVPDEVEICYVTRPYLTRHGNGPFETEGIDIRPDKYETNHENMYQGKFRYGELDVSAMLRRTCLDYTRWKDGYFHPSKVNLSFSITHLDERELSLPDVFKTYKFNSHFGGQKDEKPS